VKHPDQPQWLKLLDKLSAPIIGVGLDIINAQHTHDPDINVASRCALLHFTQCLQTSMTTNEDGKHAVAICLVRQCIETLTIIDVALQDYAYAEPLLNAWKHGKKTQGNLRSSLEHDVWARYGKGLWDETWAEYFANLSKAVQPYAHYTHELQGWQLAIISTDYEQRTYFAIHGFDTYDELKAARISLLHALATWTLGRLLSANSKIQQILELAPDVDKLGRAIGSSFLLFKNKDWGQELLPDMLLAPGRHWWE